MANEAHIRIDEGIKRGRRPPKYPQPKVSRPAEGQLWTIPVNLDPDQVLTEYLVAKSTSGIAAKYGIRRAALTRWISQQRPKEWREVQVIRALCTKEDGQEGIYDARTALHLARGRELLKSAQWDLERLDSTNYGQKQEITHNIVPVLSITVAPQQPNEIIDLPSDAVQQIEKPVP